MTPHEIFMLSATADKLEKATDGEKTVKVRLYRGKQDVRYIHIDWRNAKTAIPDPWREILCKCRVNGSEYYNITTLYISPDMVLFDKWQEVITHRNIEEWMYTNEIQ